MKLTLLTLIAFGAALAQDPLPMKNSPAIVKVTRTGAVGGAQTVTFTPVVMDTTVTLGTNNVITALTATAPVTAPPPVFGSPTWMTLSVSATDPLTWCFPGSGRYAVALVHTQGGLTVSQMPNNQGTQTFVQDAYMVPSQPLPSGAVQTAPVMLVSGACSGGLGLVFPSNGLATGQTRDAVFALVLPY